MNKKKHTRGVCISSPVHVRSSTGSMLLSMYCGFCRCNPVIITNRAKRTGKKTYMRLETQMHLYSSSFHSVVGGHVLSLFNLVIIMVNRAKKITKKNWGSRRVCVSSLVHEPLSSSIRVLWWRRSLSSLSHLASCRALLVLLLQVLNFLSSSGSLWRWAKWRRQNQIRTYNKNKKTVI